MDGFIDVRAAAKSNGAGDEKNDATDACVR